MPEEEFLISQFRKAIRRKGGDDILDLDEKFPHKFEFQVHRFEEVLKDTDRIIPPNKWSYHRIVLIKNGSGNFKTGIYNYTAKKNTLVVIPSRVITSSKDWTPDMKGYVLLFNIDFFLQNNFSHKNIENKKVLNSTLQPYINLTDKESEKITDIFETILKEKKLKNKFSKELIALKIVELVIMCERFFDETLNFGAAIPTTDLIRRFISLVEANFLKEHSVRFYADKLAVHPNYLNALIKKHTGLTAKDAIQNRLFLETKYLLHSTNLTIKEISNKAGFNDPNYFTVFFKRLEKKSPANYRTASV